MAWKRGHAGDTFCSPLLCCIHQHEWVMQYSAALESLIAAMREELGTAIRAARDAEEYATHEEARAKSQWDTQGLESSYLAAGQAGRAKEIAEGILALEHLRHTASQVGTDSQVATDAGVGSLVECDWGDSSDWFLIVPKGGGTSAKVGKSEVTSITPESALGQALAGKRTGDRFKFANGTHGTVGGVKRS